jgi:hypothetical protein
MVMKLVELFCFTASKALICRQKEGLAKRSRNDLSRALDVRIERSCRRGYIDLVSATLTEIEIDPYSHPRLPNTERSTPGGAYHPVEP